MKYSRIGGISLLALGVVFVTGFLLGKSTLLGIILILVGASLLKYGKG